MKQFLIILILVFCSFTQVFAQADRNIRYVAVHNAALKSSTGFFARTVGSLSFGDTVTLVSETGKWSQIRFGSLTGWVESAKLITRRVITNSSTGASATEVTLAGKGFSQELELEYQRGGYDFTFVDLMEQSNININTEELLYFINEGRLNRGD
jgi:uncharacterized protein YgiM (DUF1202 family)